MKLHEIFEGSLLGKSNNIDKDCDNSRKNTNTAKRIVNAAKDKAKEANPGESETDVQAHLGSHVSSFINR